MTDITFTTYVGPGNGGVAMPPLRVVGSNATNTGFARLPQPTLSATAIQGATAHGASSFARPRVVGADRTNIAASAFSAPELTAAGGFATPSVNLGASLFPFMHVGGTVATTGYGQGDISLPTVVLASDANVLGRSQMSTRVHAFASSTNDPVLGGAIVMSPPGVLFSNSYGGINLKQTVSDGLLATDDFETGIIHALLDFFQVSDSAATLARSLQQLVDGFTLADVARSILRMNLLDGFLASVTPIGTAQLTVFLSDGWVATDTPISIAQVMAAVADGFCAFLTLNTGAETYTAWVMTTETRAMRSYSNFPFNSFTTFGGKLIAAGPLGIYEMGGDTDSGTPIITRLVTDALNLGTEDHLKRVDRVYIGGTMEGAMVLKVCATTLDGKYAEHCYRLRQETQGSGGLHRYRADIGRGFRSVYWTFELMSDEEGSAFKITDMTPLPVVLTGRTF